MDKKLVNLLKDENIKYYIWVDCNNKTINKVNKTIIGKKTLSIPYIGLDVIKRNNRCNYFKFREYTHDLKSIINSVFGMASILTYDIEEAKKDDITGLDIENMKGYAKDMNSSINDLVAFISVEVQCQETNLSGRYNLSELLVYYMPTYSDYFVIGSDLDSDYEDTYNIIKRIIDILNKDTKENLIFKRENDVLIVKAWNGEARLLGTIPIKLAPVIKKSELLNC